jgi:signal transduction histidine kinase
LAITPSEGSPLVPHRTEIWLVLAGGIVASLLAGFGVHLFVSRRKTRKELESLRELAEAKTRFLGSVSHELRTPLTAVLGFAELLRDEGGLTREERNAALACIAEEAGDLSGIIDDLLVTARAELSTLTVVRVSVAPAAQLAQVLDNGSSRLLPSVEVVTADDTIRALGDPGRVRQILRNLLTNAARYGGEKVEVRITRAGDTVRIEVADDGNGVPPAQGEAIFERYTTVQGAAGQPDALGIGLSISRELARLMGGDLTYHRREGWTVFELALPAAPVGTEAKPAATTAAGPR